MNINALWRAYQDGQGNEDKTAREVFYEVVDPYLIAQTEPVAEVPCSVGLEGLTDLLKEAMHIMDERGRSISNHTKGLWDDEWEKVRSNIFKAYEALNEKAA